MTETRLDSSLRTVHYMATWCISEKPSK